MLKCVLEKPLHGILASNESPRPLMSHPMSKTSSTKRPNPDDKLKKRSQISKELSDMVVYVQVSVLCLLIYKNKNIKKY